jgi:Ca-activated chloride channel family protein
MAGRPRRAAVSREGVRTWAVAAFVLAAASSPVHAQSGTLIATSAGRADAAVLSLREMTIDASVARGYARVNVRQIFENHTDEIQEGTYRFALGTGAAVGDFAVWDGVTRIPGVILEKRRARAIYDALGSQRVDPGLLQQGEEEDGGAGSSSSAGTFSVRVAPILARATKRLELQFQQEVPVVGLRGEFRMALPPLDGEPLVARTLRIKVALEGLAYEASAIGLPLKAVGDGLTYEGTNVLLDKDLVVRFRLREPVAPLRLSTFRNPDGRLPDGVALAPWERPSDIPPEKDGFFLMEVVPPASAPPSGASGSTSRCGAIGSACAGLRRHPLRYVALAPFRGPRDFLSAPRAPSRCIDAGRSVRADSVRQRGGRARRSAARRRPAAKTAALDRLRARPLSPGTRVIDAVTAAQRLVGETDRSRIVLFTDGVAMPGSKDLNAARRKAPLFASVATSDTGAALRGASDVAVTALSSEPETDLFFERIVGARKPATGAAPGAAASSTQGLLSVTVGDPGLRDIYPVMVQPPTAQSLSGFIGRYAKPATGVRFALASGILPKASSTLDATLPAKALEARDLPRRWARARVDDLLRRIEAEGERREWVAEIIELSRRFKFVTPYTAFLAAPRSLLRPRRIQPGDPVLRVECDEGTVRATALFPFGLRLPLVKRPNSNLFEGRFLVPESLKDGRYSVQIVMRDRAGETVTESKTFVIDGRAPKITPRVAKVARVGDDLILTASTDDDVIFLSARVGSLPPVPMRWDRNANASVGRLRLPSSVVGSQEIVFEAVDQAKNVGFGRATIEVRP